MSFHPAITVLRCKDRAYSAVLFSLRKNARQGISGVTARTTRKNNRIISYGIKLKYNVGVGKLRDIADASAGISFAEMMSEMMLFRWVCFVNW